MADTKKSLAQVPAGSATTGSSLLGVDGGAIKRFPITALANLLYPVGSYYWSSNPTDPGTLFGGTWEQIKDRFILAAGGSYTVGSTGGEATHTLTVDEMPSHDHRIRVFASEDGLSGKTLRDAEQGKPLAARWNEYYNLSSSKNIEQRIDLTGGGAAHNNMPPYIVAYCWHRTA